MGSEPIDNYAILEKLVEVIEPPEDDSDPNLWHEQLNEVLEILSEFEDPAYSKLDELADEKPQIVDEDAEIDEYFHKHGYIAGLGASIAQNEYWIVSLVVEKVEGYLNASPEDADLDDALEMVDEFSRYEFLYSYLMWKSGVFHLMYMNHDSFFMNEHRYRFIDYHDKMYTNFAILTASTLVETTLERALLERGVENADEKDFATAIQMAASRFSIDEADEGRLNSLREIRNMVAHDILPRTDSRGTTELTEFDSHFEATFGVVVESLNIVSRILMEEYEYSEPLYPFYLQAEEMVNYVKDARQNTSED